MTTPRQSMETILNFDNADAVSQWSERWSTSQIPGMDQGMGLTGPKLRAWGRRRLRYASLTLCSFLTMHCRVTSSALTGGLFVFMLFLALAVAVLANPLRHFEVYLGQWSMNGPGRAFRIVPLFEGVGMAMCINSIFRAINACATASLTATYVMHTVQDDDLPFTYCRDFDYKYYDPTLKQISYFKWKPSRYSRDSYDQHDFENDVTRAGYTENTFNNHTKKKKKRLQTTRHTTKIEACKETYPPPFPLLHITPPYNYLYVQVAGVRPGYNLRNFDWTHLIILACLWTFIWSLMIWERVSHGRLIWNNIPNWLLPLPWIWSIFIIVVALTNLTFTTTLQDILHIGTKEIIGGLTDAFAIALYIHSASCGTELIIGKGLNHFASGHIDPIFNKENVMHSGLMVLLTGLHSTGASLCSLVDSKQPNSTTTFDYTHESTFWTLAMYSKCMSLSRYSHMTSTLIFLGLTISYITVAYVLLKTALHIIFEYRVQLVFVEQLIVGLLIVACAAVSVLFTTEGGLVLLECCESLLTGVVTPMIAMIELVGLLYVYRSHDFISDANIAMEENACSGRIGIQWQIIPVIAAVTLITNISTFTSTLMPRRLMLLGSIPIFLIIIVIPARVICNIYNFMRPKQRR